MLPLSGLREAVSKSNSVSLVPSTTTTRVSSGWLASINIRRAIGALLEAWGTDRRERPDRPCRLSGARGTVRFDPPNGLPNWPRRGRCASPDRITDPADLEVPDKPPSGAPPPKGALQATTTARGTQHTVFAASRQSKDGISRNCHKPLKML